MKKILSLLLISVFLFCGCYNNKSLESYIPAFASLKNIDEYEIKGIDVSRYQGNIDWEYTSEQNIKFAYIKSTQKDNYCDPLYKDNVKQALKYGINVGSYHYFTFSESPSSQADNFIRNSIYKKGFLPPAIDIEIENQNNLSSINVNEIQNNIHSLLDEVKKHYKTVPLIYTNKFTYNILIDDTFNDYPIWIANYSNNPSIPNNHQWTFWQYSKEGSIKNTDGSFKNVDLNVFYGTYDEFKNLIH